MASSWDPSLPLRRSSSREQSVGVVPAWSPDQPRAADFRFGGRLTRSGSPHPRFDGRPGGRTFVEAGLSRRVLGGPERDRRVPASGGHQPRVAAQRC